MEFLFVLVICPLIVVTASIIGTMCLKNGLSLPLQPLLYSQS